MTSTTNLPGRICCTCRDNVAAAGKLECGHCDASRRFRDALGERLYRLSGMEPRITEVPQPRESDLWERQLRMEVPLDRKPASAIDVALRRLMVVAGAVLLIVFTAGWLLGRFAR